MEHYMRFQRISCSMRLQGPTDPASEIGSPSKVGQWILKNADQAGLSGYEYTADYHAFSQYTQFLYNVYAENMIQIMWWMRVH